jgi:hypothetical protein
MTTRIVRTQGTGTSTKKFTLSAWVKKSSNTTSNDQVIFDNYASGSDRMTLYFTSSATLGFYAVKGGSDFNIVTNRVFRDVNAWYHIVLRVDTDQGNNAHRSRLYINGTEETSFGTASYASSGFALPMGTSSYTTGFGWYGGGGSSVFLGCMSHLNFIDGEDRTPDYFGETDSTTGEWKIKTSISGVTYGNNGFFILKDGNSLTDQSGESNNFTLNTGTLTKTEDNPSNVFCTMNILSKGSDISLSNGNTTVGNSQLSNQSITATIACGSGKYYWEAKCTSNTANYSNIGVTLSSAFGGNHSQVDAGRVMWSSNGNLYREGLGLGAVSLGALGTNDIIGVALDTENGTLKFYKDGTLTHTETNTAFLFTNNEFIPASGLRDGGGWNYNFGNGYFGTTAVSSAGTNASNNGIFEYDVPSGYTALSTKGLNL